MIKACGRHIPPFFVNQQLNVRHTVIITLNTEIFHLIQKTVIIHSESCMNTFLSMLSQVFCGKKLTRWNFDCWLKI